MLQQIVNSTALMLPAILSVPTGIFAAECLAGSTGRPWENRSHSGPRARVAILVPAHNEELNIGATVANIRPQMLEGDRLLVVADNCTDLTAALARIAGAEVVERTDTVRRGKGYALDAGLRYLETDPPEIVVVVDADCRLDPDALDHLVRMASATGKPIQARYLLTAPEGTRLDLAVSEFAVLLKNRIRLLGLSRLGLPAQLTGSGMAFPWQALRQVQLASGHLVEDMKLGLDLARIGKAPLFCDAAVVMSEFPHSSKGLETQSARWETGRFALLRPLLSSLVRLETFRNPRYLVLVLDALVPPLTLLGALLSASLLAAALLTIAGSSKLALLFATMNMAAFAAALAAAWWRHGRALLPLQRLGRLPVFVLKKLTRYPSQVLGSRNAAWVRTDRNRPSGV
jgi:cellulose synthase/poly-beta-1,6-N-acetylglucosamine synthase-like glycosyltransferase